MNLLLKHHLIAGWRNILKYKVQNIISVLCLAVGTVMFAVVYSLINSAVFEKYNGDFYNDSYSLLMKDSDSFITCKLSEDDLSLMQRFKSVKSITYMSDARMLNLRYKLKDGTILQHGVFYRIVSPDWLEENNYSSALTGKKFGKLKNGTVLIFDRSLKKEHSEDLNPQDIMILNKKQKLHISDVIRSKQYNPSISYHGLLIVCDYKHRIAFDKENAEDSLSFYDPCIKLKDGVGKAQFIREARKKCPQIELCIQDNDMDMRDYFLSFIFLFLGASVLLIGLSGYLKMQIQLFYLRNREMILRRCNGAKPIQLFMLLAFEMLITFCFVLIIAIGLSEVLYAYAIPKIQELNTEFYLLKAEIYNIEFWIVVFTLIISAIIAGLSVRKIMRMPLGKAAGKNYIPKALFKYVLQVVQYFVASILLLLVLLSYLLTEKTRNEYALKNDISFYKDAVMLPQYDDNLLDKMPSVKHVARIGCFANVMVMDPTTIKILGGSVVVNKGPRMDIVDKKDYPYVVVLGDTIRMAPLFAKKDEAVKVCKQLGIKYNPFHLSEVLQMYPLEPYYITIGFVTKMDIYDSKRFCVMYYVVRPKMTHELANKLLDQANKDSLNRWGGPVEVTRILFPKKGQRQKMIDELEANFKKLFPKKYQKHIQLSFRSVYDQFFRELTLIDLIRQFCYVLIVVSIISIVLSVYSSVSLETRGRQRNVAIRKVNGAKTRDIIWFFARPYVKMLSISFILTAIVVVGILYISGFFSDVSSEDIWSTLYYLVLSYVIITLVTFLTIWQKIYKVAKTKPAEIIQNS